MSGSIDRYTTKAGERLWRIRWDLPPGPAEERRQRTRRGFRTKREASAALAEVIHEQHNRGRVSVRSDVRFSEFAKTWLMSRRDLKATSLDNLRTQVEVHLIPRLGTRRVQELTSEDVAWLFSELAERGKRAGKCRTAGFTCAEHDCSPNSHAGLAPKSLGHVHAALRSILAAAVEDGLIPSSPAETKRARQSRPRGEATAKVAEDRCWSTDQARAFVPATANDRLAALWLTLLGTGMRRGEALALRWEDVDLDVGMLHLRRSVTTVRGQVVKSQGGKTAAATRRLVLGAELVSVLREHRKRQAAERLAAGPAWNDADAVFTEPDGRPLHPNKASTAFSQAAGAAKLPPVGLHGLRHTHATMLLRAGVPIPAVAQRLGHANPSITLAVYSHALPADDALAAEATTRALFGAVSA